VLFRLFLDLCNYDEWTGRKLRYFIENDKVVMRGEMGEKRSWQTVTNIPLFSCGN
jgi:hypothetical protein